MKRRGGGFASAQLHSGQLKSSQSGDQTSLSGSPSLVKLFQWKLLLHLHLSSCPPLHLSTHPLPIVILSSTLHPSLSLPILLSPSSSPPLFNHHPHPPPPPPPISSPPPVLLSTYPLPIIILSPPPLHLLSPFFSTPLFYHHHPLHYLHTFSSPPSSPPIIFLHILLHPYCSPLLFHP